MNNKNTKVKTKKPMDNKIEKRSYKKRLVTKKEGLILLLLYVFRFLNSKQIQEFLRHKDHRRINSWLKDLAEKGYIVRDFKPIYGILTKPTVCYLTATGRGYIRSSHNYYFPKYLKKIARDNKSTKSFHIRCQLIADWYLTFYHSSENVVIDIIDYLENILAKGSKNVEEKITKESQFFTSAYYPSFVLLKEIKPDGYVRKKVPQGIVHGMLFVLDAYIPKLLLRYKVQGIFEKLNEENWEDDSIESLNIYFLCPNNVIINYFRRLVPSFLQSYYGSKPLNFFFVTRNQMYKYKDQDVKIKWVILSSTD